MDNFCLSKRRFALLESVNIMDFMDFMDEMEINKNSPTGQIHKFRGYCGLDASGLDGSALGTKKPPETDALREDCPPRRHREAGGDPDHFITFGMGGPL